MKQSERFFGQVISKRARREVRLASSQGEERTLPKLRSSKGSEICWNAARVDEEAIGIAIEGSKSGCEAGVCVMREARLAVEEAKEVVKWKS